MWKSYFPRPPLSQFVERLWLFEGPPPPHAKERLIPSASMEIVINLHEDRTQFYDGDSFQRGNVLSGQVLVGPTTGPLVIGSAERRSVMGIHFHPGGAFPFLNLPCGELRDRQVDLECLWGSARTGKLRNRLLHTPNHGTRFLILEEFLLSQTCRSLQHHSAVGLALTEFSKHRSVAEAVSRTGFSQRHLIQIFNSEIGLTPKLYCRLQRFERLLRSIDRSSGVDWADTAAQFGYFDQAHFSHDFREFTGITPADYLAEDVRNPRHVPMVV